MKIKHLIMLCSVLIPLVTKAEVYFEAGMKWDVEYTAQNHDYYYETMMRSTIMAQTNNEDPELSLGFYSIGDDGEPVLAAYVKVENEQVFIRPIDEELTEWYLLYDFGLQPAEGKYFYMPRSEPFKGNPIRMYLKCNSIDKNYAYGDWDVMIMEEFHDDSCAESEGEGIWIKGLSSAKGVMMNMYFNALGGNSELIAAYLDNEKIFGKVTNGMESIPENTVIFINGMELTIPGIESADKGVLYSIDGRIIKEFNVVRGASIIVEESGIYILKAGLKSQVIRIQGE